MSHKKIKKWFNCYRQESKQSGSASLHSLVVYTLLLVIVVGLSRTDTHTKTSFPHSLWSSDKAERSTDTILVYKIWGKAQNGKTHCFSCMWVSLLCCHFHLFRESTIRLSSTLMNMKIAQNCLVLSNSGRCLQRHMKYFIITEYHS